MGISVALIKKLDAISDPALRTVLYDILEEMERQTSRWETIVTKTEFNELKKVIAELAETQKQTEQRLNELAEAQKKTEQAVKELVEVQKKTEQRLDRLEQTVAELAEAQKKTEEEIRKLTREMSKVKKEIGGLARNVGFALENEAYRYLPKFLEKRYGIHIIDRIIRTYIAGKEINIFAKAQDKDGKQVYLVGEASLKLDDAQKLKQVWKNANLIKTEFGTDVIPILVAHFAKPKVLEKAQEAGVIVVQSFEWI